MDVKAGFLLVVVGLGVGVLGFALEQGSWYFCVG